MLMTVTVYSTPTCPFCIQVKEFLNEKNVEFADVDVSTDQEKAQEMIHKSGQMGVPVIEVGEELVVGFDKAKLEELLEL